MKYSSKKDTLKHIRQVRKNIGIILRELRLRGKLHDMSKVQSPEKYGLDIFAPIQTVPTRHESLPEHYEQGIRGMSLIDLLEMFCDWYAATKRHNNGDIMKSISINQERFGYSDDLKAVFENTYKDMFM
jgi:hypothetical protein